MIYVYTYINKAIHTLLSTSSSSLFIMHIKSIYINNNYCFNKFKNRTQWSITQRNSTIIEAIKQLYQMEQTVN